MMQKSQKRIRERKFVIRIGALRKTKNLRTKKIAKETMILTVVKTLNTKLLQMSWNAGIRFSNSIKPEHSKKKKI